MCQIVKLNHVPHQQISTTISTKRPFPTNIESGKVLKEDEALGTDIRVLNKAQEQKQVDAFTYMTDKSHMSYVL